MSGASLEGCTILLVEDEPLIALDIADALRASGSRVHSVGSMKDALASLHMSLSAAVVDYRLGDGTADDLCEALTKMGIPFIIYSGYHASDVEGACSKWGVITKPVSPAALVATVIALLPLQNSRPSDSN